MYVSMLAKLIEYIIGNVSILVCKAVFELVATRFRKNKLHPQPSADKYIGCTNI